MPPLDDADKKFIADAIGASLTADVLGKTVGEVVQTHLKAAGLDKIGETVKGLGEKVGTLEKAPPKNEPDDKGDKGKKPNETDPAMLRMQAELDAVKKERDAEKAAALAQKQDADLRAILAKNGVPADRLEVALPYLRASNKLVQGEDGSLTMKITKHGVEAPAPLDEAIAAFVKSDTGKMFLPPVGGGGSGDDSRNGRAQPGGGGGTIDSLDQLGRAFGL